MRSIQGFNKGETEGFIEVYETFYSHAFHFAYKMLAHEAEAKDIVSETFMRVWERRKQLKTGNDIRRYVRKCVYNACVDRIRKVKVENKIQIDLLYNEDFKEQPKLLAETYLVKEDRIRTLLEEIEKLPSQMRKVMQLRLAGKSNEEIAHALSVSEKTVKNSFYEAKCKLKLAFFKDPALSIFLIALMPS